MSVPMSSIEGAADTCPLCVDNRPRELRDGRWVHPAVPGEWPKFEPCAFQETGVRRGDWIQAWTGRAFFARDPRPDDFHILDIAAGLRNARYSAQSTLIETVAEHSVLMWRASCARGYSPRVRRGALMHDGSEAYLVDVPRPIKRDLSNYAAIEDGIMRALAGRFDFDWPLDYRIKALDNDILNDEFAQNMAPPPQPWRQLNGLPLGVEIACLSPNRAMLLWLQAAAIEGMV